MRGGKISENKAGYGAGVVVLDNCKFIMTGGEITENICDFGDYQDQDGAGVFAPILLLSVVAMAFVGVVSALEKRLIRWRND